MKRKIVFFISVLILLSVVCPLQTVFAADLSDNIVLQLTETHTDNEIVINVNLVTNTGISAMTLELVYDNNVFEFTGYEKGSALEKFDLMSTDRSNDPTLPVKFNWFNLNSEVDNDFSTGNLLQLYFTLKSDRQNGKSEIGFKYNPETDIIYTQQNGDLPTKSAAIGKAVVNVATNKITEIEIEDAEASAKNVNVPLIVGIVASAVVVLSTVITVLVVKARKEKRKKKNWLKL